MAEIIGTSGDETLTGTSGADVIRALEGNDRLYGLGGHDQLWGGAGDDVYYIDDASGDQVFELAGQGYDIVYVAGSYVLRPDSHVELLSTNNHAAATAINLTGNGLNNTLLGNAGANVLHGGGGVDLLAGFGGDDIYYTDVAGTQVVEQVGGGSDALYTSVSYALAANASIEILSTNSHAGTTPINLTGNGLDQIIVGNAGANAIHGGGGVDVLRGMGGDDIYYVDVSATKVHEEAAGGYDAVYASISYVLGATSHVEVLSTNSHAATTAINLTGNGLSNQLFGNAGANVLQGGGGVDVLTGFGGNDIYYTDVAATRIVEAAGGGADALYTSVSYALGAATHVEILSTNSHAATSAIGLTGNEFGNMIYGNAGANRLDGKGGADTLTGFGGADTFAFTAALGAGNVDLVADFDTGTGADRIWLGGAAGEPFAALASGLLHTSAFTSGAAATAVGHRIVYNAGTGALLYDADGVGGASAVQFAFLAAGLPLEASHFFIGGPANNLSVITSSGTASVAENSPVSTIVYQAAASDPDGDSLTFVLEGLDRHSFTIDSAGALRFVASPDFEAKSSYELVVRAVDSSGGGGQKPVNITVTDQPEASTPIVNETAAANDGTATAQPIDRALLAVAPHPNLPNDDLPSATIVGNLPNSSDRDFFAITLHAGELLILDVDNSGGNLDTMVRVYNAGGVEIASNDDPGSLDPGSDPHEYGHNTDSLLSFRAPGAGTFYFSIESYPDPEHPTFGSYELHVSIGPPASAAELLEEDVQALISGARWSTTALTYAFPNEANDYPAGFGDPSDPEPASFAPFTGAQQSAVGLMLHQISGVTALTFGQLLHDDEGSAQLRYAMTGATEAAHAYYPGSRPEAGSAWFNKVNFNSPVPGNYAWSSMLHETGHALGLKHGHESPAISYGRDTLEYTVMTYRSYSGAATGEDGGYTNEIWGYPQTLMMLDIAALQRTYGANFTHNAGDTIYTWSPTTGQMSINGAGQGAPGGNRVFMTIWDGGGNDVYDLSAYASATLIDLRPGEWVRTSAIQLANLGHGHMARGNIANALQFEGDPRSLIENAVGGSGNDLIIANQAPNRLSGGGGADTFVWSASAVGVGAQADFVTDFLRGADRLDLSGIDADLASQADNGFAFIGTNAFTGQAGQLRYQSDGANLRVQGDWNGDGIADLEILVHNADNSLLLSSTDFVL